VSDLILAQTELEQMNQSAADRNAELEEWKQRAEKLAVQLQFQNQEASRKAASQILPVASTAALEAELSTTRADLQAKSEELRAAYAAQREVEARVRDTAHLDAEQKIQAAEAQAAALAAQLAEARRMLAFYTANIGEVSRQAKSTKAASDALQVKLQDRERMINDQASLISVLRMQAGRQ
jgi:chromosome segregation ATPase